MKIPNLIKICVEKIQNEALLFAVIAILVIVSFPETRVYIFVIYAVAILLYSVITIIGLYRFKSANKFLENFEKFLKDKSNWEKREIDDSEIYFYKEDNNYQIKNSNDYRREWTARESWMEHFPDHTITERKVYLEHGTNKIAEFSFLLCDGCRYFIPIPKKKCIKIGENYSCLKFEYYWINNSIEYNLGEVIGSFYDEKDLEQTAKFCGIKVL